MKIKNQIFMPLLATFIIIMLLISRLIDSSLLTRESEYIGIIILEILIFAFPCIIFTRFFPQNAGNTLKIRLFSPDKIFFAAIAAILLIFGSLMYGFLINGLSDTDTSFTLYKVFTAKKTDALWGNFHLIIAYALVPAIFEEFSFRGVIASGYENFSPVYSVLMSSVFFAMIHFDLKTLPFHLIAGIVLGITLYATGSIFVPITVHFLYNLFFIFASDYVNTFIVADSNFTFFIIGIVFFIAAFLFCGECRSLYKKKSLTAPIEDKSSSPRINALEIFLSPTAVVSYLLYFAVEFLK